MKKCLNSQQILSQHLFIETMTTIPISHYTMAGVIISAFLISLLVTGLIIPKILLIAFRKNLFDEVNERKIHKGAVPRLGGISFVPAVMFTFSLIYGLTQIPEVSHLVIEMSDIQARAIAFGFCGLILLFLVGIADDLVGVLYRAKFVMQIIAACLLIIGGLWIDNLHGFCGVYEWPDICGCMLTILVCVFFVNAINLIDGIDGLASGLSSVALLSYGIVFGYMGDMFNAIIAFATLGALVQFFYYNVFGKPALGKKIFMGDTGALCIGFILTYLSVTISRVPNFTFTDFNPIIVAFAPMLVPCLDVLRVFFNRIRNGVSPFLPDKTHIHHKLLALGRSTPRAMVSILCMSGGLVLFNVLLSPMLDPAILLLIDVAGWCVYNSILSKKIKQRNSK